MQYNEWSEFLRIEDEILKKLGQACWDSYPPVDPSFLLRVKKEQKKSSKKYETKIGSELKKLGVYSEHQGIVLNRMVPDFVISKEKIIIEVDDSSHLEEANKLNDERKDQFVSGFGYITFRLKSPYTQDGLKKFCIAIKDEFLKRGGQLFNYNVPVRIIKFKKKRTIDFISYRDFQDEIKTALRGVYKWRRKRKIIMQSFSRIKDENKYGWAMQKLEILKEQYKNIVQSHENKKSTEEVKTIIIKKQNGIIKRISLRDCPTPEMK